MSCYVVVIKYKPVNFFKLWMNSDLVAFYQVVKLIIILNWQMPSRLIKHVELINWNSFKTLKRK